MFANLSKQRSIFLIAILALALTAVISLGNSAFRTLGVNTFTARMPQNGAPSGAPGAPGTPPGGDFVPPSDFQPRNLGQNNTNSSQSSQDTRGSRFGGMGALGGFAGRSGSTSVLGSLFRLGINPRWMVWIGLGISVLFLVGLLFSANAALHGRKWGLNLATLLAILSLVTSIPSLMALPSLFQRGFNLSFMLTPVLSLTNVIAAAVILILAILPSFRDEFAMAPVEEGDDR